MTGESHAILGGVATYTYLLTNGYTPTNQGVLPFTLAVGFGALIALLPDIDSPENLFRQSLGIGNRQTSRPFRQMRRRGLIPTLVGFVLWLVSRALNGLDWVLPHRGPTHWLVVAAALCYAVYWACGAFGWSSLVWESFAVGYASHLVADAFTVSGLKLFSPFYDKSIGIPLRFLRIRTGSWQEGTMVLAMIGAMGLYLAYYQ